LPAVIRSFSAKETFALGKSLASLLTRGSVVALTGALGSGKTCLTKGIANGLGIEDELTSPTYTIISEYEAVISGDKIPFYHIDAYRLRGNDDFSSIGGEEIIFGNGISVIEWSEHILSFVPSGALKADIEMGEDGSRIIRIYQEPVGLTDQYH
jgi:tRNA threonylcarbamoyladenosine biosynthesis protein TsaE